MTGAFSLQAEHNKNIVRAAVKNVVVLYRSKYGSTKRYASWIAENTKADMFDLSVFDSSRLEEYSVILFGSSVYFGKIKHVNFIKYHWQILSKKRTALFYVSGIPSHDPRQKRIMQKSLPDEIQKGIACYPLRGAFDYKGLDFLDKLVMSWPKIMLQAKWLIKKDSNIKQSLNRFCCPQDWTRMDAIEPVVSFARQEYEG
jgi:menaquinone-dependent protoporphyrinogen IX oxidase